ncbi:membrane protein FxsA [Geotalea uraniireducens]|uniref:Membrane protein FxsA n=1 Tax=Geotalea uraniireducens TaxID=351604 RepID=A0ABM8ENJ4_9BACT|nr:FxsA family protein [Geotalea uraniireducens]BDV44011.1 membrane protein FxsA [Geotalea uraniireducens]
MLLRLFLLFTIIPVVELYLLIRVGRLIGALPTVALILAISMAGAWLVRAQGFAILGRIQTELAQGRIPAGELLDGALVLAGGILLLTPGFFTDFLGLFFLTPPTRRIIKQFLGLWLQRKLASGQFVIRRF